jgi:hypothetical protein
MRIVRSLVLAAVLVAVGAGHARPALAADGGTVDVDVTAAMPCLIVSPTTVHFGTLPFTPDQYSDAGTGIQSIGYESCAGIQETVYARGTDAAGPSSSWTLTKDGVPCATPGGNLYRLWLGAAASGYLDTTDQEIETLDAGAIGAVSNLFLQMPCVGSDGAGETMALQVIFTASF